MSLTTMALADVRNWSTFFERLSIFESPQKYTQHFGSWLYSSDHK